jgi:hypothetical protein
MIKDGTRNIVSHHITTWPHVFAKRRTHDRTSFLRELVAYAKQTATSNPTLFYRAEMLRRLSAPIVYGGKAVAERVLIPGRT